MAQGARYYVYGRIPLYWDSDRALNKTPTNDWIEDGLSLDGTGATYINDFAGYEQFYPAIPLWWIPSQGGPGYSIGWINETENGMSVYVGASGVKRAKAVFVGASGVKRAKAVYVGTPSGVKKVK